MKKESKEMLEGNMKTQGAVKKTTKEILNLLSLGYLKWKICHVELKLSLKKLPQGL